MSLFQINVDKWMLACFGRAIQRDRVERNFRFLEESLELVQALGCTKEQTLRLVDYVFSRPAGDVGQEVGGTMVTLSALCTANDIVLETEAFKELARVWQNIDVIRKKQASKAARGVGVDNPVP